MRRAVHDVHGAAVHDVHGVAMSGKNRRRCWAFESDLFCPPSGGHLSFERVPKRSFEALSDGRFFL